MSIGENRVLNAEIEIKKKAPLHSGAFCTIK